MENEAQFKEYLLLIGFHTYPDCQQSKHAENSQLQKDLCL